MYLNGNLVNLVEEVYGGYVYPVALDNVDDVIGRGITTEGDVGIVDTVLCQDTPDHLQIQSGLYRLHTEQADT